jgi:hypothetical protein
VSRTTAAVKTISEFLNTRATLIVAECITFRDARNCLAERVLRPAVVVVPGGKVQELTGVRVWNELGLGGENRRKSLRGAALNNFLEKFDSGALGLEELALLA